MREATQWKALSNNMDFIVEFVKIQLCDSVESFRAPVHSMTYFVMDNICVDICIYTHGEGIYLHGYKYRYLMQIFYTCCYVPIYIVHICSYIQTRTYIYMNAYVEIPKSTYAYIVKCIDISPYRRIIANAHLTPTEIIKCLYQLPHYNKHTCNMSMFMIMIHVVSKISQIFQKLSGIRTGMRDQMNRNFQGCG